MRTATAFVISGHLWRVPSASMYAVLCSARRAVRTLFRTYSATSVPKRGHAAWFVNVVDLLKAPAAKRPSARPQRLVFDILFTRDKPICFAFNGYPWLTYRRSCRRSAAARAPRRADSAADTV